MICAEGRDILAAVVLHCCGDEPLHVIGISHVALDSQATDVVGDGLDSITSTCDGNTKSIRDHAAGTGSTNALAAGVTIATGESDMAAIVRVYSRTRSPARVEVRLC